MTSPAQALVARASTSPDPRGALARAIAGLTPKELAALWFEWRCWARPEQLAPSGDWDTWLLCTGIGFGKTRSGAEWIRAEVEAAAGTGFVPRIALVGATAADVRDTMIEGESGILAVSPPKSWGIDVDYESSKRRITWYRGGAIIATATCFSAEEPDRLRGPNISHAWCDELAAWENLLAAWLNLQGRMRLGPHPKVCVTTTPRPLALLREIAADPKTVTVRGSSYANAANLPDRYKRQLKKHDGTEYGRQEVGGELLDDRQGALFSGAWFRRVAIAPDLTRVAVGVDPAKKESKRADETGIVVVGIDAAGNAYVLEDASGKYSPEGWAAKAIDCFDRHMADLIVAETNAGGDMVLSTIRSSLKEKKRAPLTVPVEVVNASRGKATRAEPVAGLYEQKKVFHVGAPERWAKLEKQMIDWDPATTQSPDRIDALVWALTELLLGEDVAPYDEDYERANEKLAGARAGTLRGEGARVSASGAVTVRLGTADERDELDDEAPQLGRGGMGWGGRI